MAGSARRPGGSLDRVGRDRSAPGSASRARSESGFRGRSDPCRPGADPRAIAAWEQRHGYRLPARPPGLAAALQRPLSAAGPLIHPLSAIGPMVPFARVPDLIVQPESWFELGNPNLETICIDLAYRWPGGGYPIFTSGDDESGSPPRIIARSFEEWFLELLRQGGREYWFDPGFADLGDPWSRTAGTSRSPPCPTGSVRSPTASRACMRAGADEREIAATPGAQPGRRRGDLPPPPARRIRRSAS